MPSIKKMARYAMTALGVNSIARRYTRHIPRVIMYHRFREAGDDDVQAMRIDHFREQVRYVKQHFVPLKVSELVSARKSNGSYPENAVALTIDDGYEELIDHALPVLTEMDVPATIFVVASLTENKGWIWTDKFNYTLDSLSRSGNEFNSKTRSELLSRLKRLQVDQRDRQLQDIAEKYEIKIPTEPPDRYRLMSWDQLRDISKTDMVEIGSHTCTHPIMNELSDEDSWYEIEHSKSMISERLDLKVTSFCFPNGQLGEYRENQKEMLERAGYLCGIASHFGYVLDGSSDYALPRINYVGGDLNLFAKYLDGVEYLQRKKLYDKLAVGAKPF